MLRARVGLVGVLAVLALGSSAASASAHVFKASKTGTLSATTKTETKFNGTLGAYSCGQATVHGSVGALEETAQKIKVQYEQCFVFGFIATFTPVEYELSASGTVSQLNKATLTFSSCTITFPSTGNQNLTKVTYSNTSAGVKAALELTGQTYETKGCAQNGLFHNGTVSGELPLDLTEGTFSWQ